MSDSYSLRDRRDPDSLLMEKRQSEYDIVASFCKDSFKIFSPTNKSEYSWEHGFFLKLIEDHPEISPRILTFWKKAPILKKLCPHWEVKLSVGAFNCIAKKSNLLDAMHYLIDLMMGRFAFTAILGHYYFLTTPRFVNEEKLFCVVVAEKYPDQAFRLLVGEIIDFNLEKSAKFTAEEICGVETILETFDSLIISKVFIECEAGYKPGDFEAALKIESEFKEPEPKSYEQEEEKKIDKKVFETDNFSIPKDCKSLEKMEVETNIWAENQSIKSSAYNSKDFELKESSISPKGLKSEMDSTTYENFFTNTEEKFEEPQNKIRIGELIEKTNPSELIDKTNPSEHYQNQVVYKEDLINSQLNILMSDQEKMENYRFEDNSKVTDFEESKKDKHKKRKKNLIVEKSKSPEKSYQDSDLNIKHEKSDYSDMKKLKEKYLKIYLG